MEILWMLVSLLGVLGLMFLTFFGLRMFNRRISTSGGRLRVIDRVSLGRESMILVISVCGKLMLVGVSSQRMEKLADLDIAEDEYTKAAFEDAQKGVVQGVLPFSDILSSFIGKKKDNITVGNDADNEEKERIKDDESK